MFTERLTSGILLLLKEIKNVIHTKCVNGQPWLLDKGVNWPNKTARIVCKYLPTVVNLSVQKAIMFFFCANGVWTGLKNMLWILESLNKPEFVDWAITGDLPRGLFKAFEKIISKSVYTTALCISRSFFNRFWGFCCFPSSILSENTDFSDIVKPPLNNHPQEMEIAVWL